MFNLFKKAIKVKTNREILIQKLIEARLAMNEIKFNDEGRCLINPNNQQALNFGWYTEQDLQDFLEGRGNIIKGKTEADKKKFWDYYVFHRDNPKTWCLSWHDMQHFDMIIDYQPKYSDGHNDNPIKINKKNPEEVIGKVMGDYCQMLTRDLLNSHSLKDFENILYRNRDELYGMKRALWNLGFGYFGACNTPTEALNLSFISDIAKYKAVYNYYVQKGYVLPDFKFVYDNQYKM